MSEIQLMRELKDRINQLKRIKYKNQTTGELDERNRKRRDSRSSSRFKNELTSHGDQRNRIGKWGDADKKYV